MEVIREMYRDTVPWPPSKYNFTPLGYIVLWIPWLILGHWAFLMFLAIVAFFLGVAGPMIFLTEQGEKLDKRYNISQKVDGLNCKIAKKLALIRSCD